MPMQNIAVVLAGGVGSRMGADRPKQLLNLAGRTLVERAVDAFDAHPAISRVAVVIHPQWRTEMEAIVARNGWHKFDRLIDGGAERHLSSMNAIRAYGALDPEATNLWLHDAARPLLSADIISRVAAALQEHPAVGVAVPSTDTIWEVESEERRAGSGEQCSVCVGRVASIPERRRMWRAQTPQAFRLGLIAEAYRRAAQSPAIQATDDCGIVRQHLPATPIAVVEGNEANIKLTSAADLRIAGQLPGMAGPTQNEERPLS